MSNQEDQSSSLRFQLIPFLIGIGLSVLPCVGLLIFFNPFDGERLQTISTTKNRDSTTPHLGLPQHDLELDESNLSTDVSSNLASIFELPTYFDSLVALDEILKTANLTKLVDLLDQSLNLQGVERRQLTQDQIFNKFTILDPIQALSHAQSFPKIQYEYFASLIYRDWSLIDFDTALTFAEQHVPTLSWEGKEAIFEQIIRAHWNLSDDEKLQIAELFHVNTYSSKAILNKIERDKPLDDPTDAFEQVLSAGNIGEEEREQLIQIAFFVIEKDGYTKFAELAESIHDRRVRTRLISSALFGRVRIDGYSIVFEQAVQLFHETARPVLFELATGWGFLDPLAALTAMSTVPSDELKKHLQELVIENWIHQGPMEVLQRLDLLPVEYREVAVAEAIWSMSANHPKETIEYLDKVSDPQTRWNVMTNMLQNWALEDIEEAFTWFLENPDVEIPFGQSRGTLLQSLLVRVTPDTAPSLFRLALQYPVDESGSGWEASIIHELAREDMTKAKEFLPLVRDGPSRINALVSIGLVVFSRDQNMDSVIEFAEELPEDEHVAFFSELLPRLSPQVAYEQIHKLPTPHAQARAALALIQKALNFSNPYTDEQMEYLESFLTDKERKVLTLDSHNSERRNR